MIIVLGQPRTGTSVTMQMLHAAGVNCQGTWPFCDHAAVRPSQMGPRDAAKVVYLGTRFDLPVDARVIVTTRDMAESLVSERKYQRLAGGRRMVSLSASAIPENLALRWQTHQAEVLGMSRDRNHLLMPFEATIDKPLNAAQALSDFIGMGDPARMASVVQSRIAKSYTGLLEPDLALTPPIGPAT